MSDSTVRLNLLGISLELESELPAFADYVRSVMRPFVVDGSSAQGAADGAGDGSGAGAQICSRLEWAEEPAPKVAEKVFSGITWERRPDRDLYIDGNRGWWLRIDDFPELKLKADFSGEDASSSTLCLTGRYYYQIGKDTGLETLRRLRYSRSLDKLRRKRFSTLLYYLVYHPVLWHLSRSQGWNALHGGGVGTPEGAIVLTGAPGCGKSTLSVAMLSDPEWWMLSDNIVLHDGVRALACPEVLLLDPRSLSFAGAGAQRLKPTGERRVFGRDAHRPDRIDQNPQPVRAVFHVNRGRETRIRGLDAEQCLRLVQSGNWMAKEVRRHHIMAEVLDLVCAKQAPDDRGSLMQLLRNVPTFELWVGQDANLSAVITDEILPRIGGS